MDGIVDGHPNDTTFSTCTVGNLKREISVPMIHLEQTVNSTKVRSQKKRWKQEMREREREREDEDIEDAI